MADVNKLFHTILALTKADLNTPNVQHGLYPLTRLATDLEYDRNFFRNKMNKGIQITTPQAQEMSKKVERVAARTNGWSNLAIDKLNNVIERNGESVRDEYLKYYWGFLYTIQSVELLKITLGLDIWELGFFKDAELKDGKYKIDISRHHLEKIKSLFTIFKFKEGVDFTKPMIPYEDFIFALAPLMQSSHNNLDLSSGVNFNTKVAIHRLLHLYELIQKPLEYASELVNEFRTKIVDIKDGETLRTVKIWDTANQGKLSSSAITKWIDQWTRVKNQGYDAFFADANNGYSNFYKYRYLPVEEDFRLFIQGKPPKDPTLFIREGSRNKFWQWFVSVYLRENVYPVI